MATVSTTGLYPEDLHGTNPLNLITAEVQTLQVPGKDDYYFIIPHAAPFFVDSLEVYNAQTGAKYKENDDYLVGHWFIEAMDSIGRPIAGSIRIMKRSITGQVRLRYRTIGGNWGFSETQILAELSKRVLNPLVRSWGQIGELPYAFPPLAHDQSIDSLVGSVEIVAALKKLADVIEASSAGASDQHLKDFNNPHKVTQKQVGLEFVQNYGMATNQEAINGVATNKYVSPANLLAAINAVAVTPMNAHINKRGNVHGLTATDINLGKVPNYPAATPTTALDVTNDAALMTPYTTTLLIQELTSATRIDELEALINKHILDTTTNPHKVTADQVGTYTKARIDQLIANATGGGGNADTFGGKTPAEWAAEFVSVVEFDKFIGPTQFGGAVAAAKTSVNDPDNTPEPYTPAQLQNYELSKITGVRAGYEAYCVNNARWDGRMVVASNIPFKPPTGQPAFEEIFKLSSDTWVSMKDARYRISGRGAIYSHGTAAINAAVGWKEDASFLPANAASAVWASKTELFIKKKSDGSLWKHKADNTIEQIVTGAANGSKEVVAVYAATQLVYPQSLVVAEIETNKVTSYQCFGDATFVSTMNTAINTVKATDSIDNICIGDDYVLFVTDTKGCFLAGINRTNPAAVSVTLLASANVFNAEGRSISIRSTELVNNAGAGEGISSGEGRYGHFAMVTNKGNPWFFGTNKDGQCDVRRNQQPIIAIAAGYNFTVTVNSLHQPQFFGDSPDNALLYAQRGILIDPDNTAGRR